MNDYADQSPRKGDPVTYQGKPAGVVTRVEGNLCWTDANDGAPFIWRFKDGLNILYDWPGKVDIPYPEHTCDEYCHFCEGRAGL